MTARGSEWGHNGRFGWSGTVYGAYFGVDGYFASAGHHQGDGLHFVDGSGAPQTGGWDWGCSHNVDARLAYNGAGPRRGFTPICTSDAYPSTGIVFDNDLNLLADPSGDGAGSLDTELGGLIAESDGLWLTFTSPVGRDSYDVGLMQISNAGAVGWTVWLTDTAGTDEHMAKLARYGTGFLVAWRSGDTTELATFAADGSAVQGAVEVGAELTAGADFVTLPNGDVGWAYADGSQFVVARVAACQ